MYPSEILLLLKRGKEELLNEVLDDATEAFKWLLAYLYEGATTIAGIDVQVLHMALDASIGREFFMEPRGRSVALNMCLLLYKICHEGTGFAGFVAARAKMVRRTKRGDQPTLFPV